VTDANIRRPAQPRDGDDRGPSAAELLQAIETAFERLQAMRREGKIGPGAVSDRQLTAAVEAARDAGVEWGRIADALDIRRGNAYQRYRRRPRPSGGASI
jgi:hypothetical protein